MKQKILTVILAAAFVLSLQTQSVQIIQATQVRQEETKEMLSEAVDDMQEGNYVEGEALVSMEATKAAALAQEGTYRFDKNVNIESVSDFGTNQQTGKNLFLVHLTSDQYTTEELMELALEQFYVDGVSANQCQQLCSADPYRKAQWYLDGEGASSTGINLLGQKVTGKSSPVIAVIDTGVNYNHPDLTGSMWQNPYPDKLPGTCGYDFGDDDADPMDQNGHGTHVAGIAAAQTDNGIGITGVSDAKIMALKIISDSDDEITNAAIIEAYDYIYEALKAGVNIKAVNCSWGGNSDSGNMIEEAVNRVGKLGALSVFAAGNDHVNRDKTINQSGIPYCLDSKYTVIVGASNEKEQAAGYSDYGAKSVDIFAPGSDMLSTYHKNLYLPGIYDSDRQKNLTAYFNRFSDTTENILPQDQTWKDYYTASDLGISTDYTVQITRMSDGKNGFLKLDVKKNKYWTSEESEIAGSIYVDVTDLNLDQNATYYVSFLTGVKMNGDICWEGENMVSSPAKSRFVFSNGKTYMRIVGLQISMQMTGMVNTWYLDDIAISKANPPEEEFGEYAYFSGTSMATPVVSGAVATLGAANPSLSAAELRKLLLKSVRKVNSLSDKCITGGVQDASKFVTLSTKVTLNKKSATLRYGKSLTLKAQLSPSYATNKAVTWKSSNTKYATVSSKGVVKVKKAGIGHTVTISATAKDGSGKKAACKIKLKK